MRNFLAVAFGLALVAISAGATSASPKDCQDALDQYHAARHDVVASAKKYLDCVHDSDGHDDCSSEFINVKSAQDDFESAVAAYGEDCQ